MRMPWENDINWGNTATTIVKGEPMTVGELIKKLQKKDRSNLVYYKDKDGYHEITSVEPCIVGEGKTLVLIMNGDGGKYKFTTEMA